MVLTAMAPIVPGGAMGSASINRSLAETATSRLLLRMKSGSGRESDVCVTACAYHTVSEVAEALVGEALVGEAAGTHQWSMQAVGPHGIPMTLIGHQPIAASPIRHGWTIESVCKGNHDAGVAEVTVTKGPDAGTRVILRPGATIVGRLPPSDLCLSDPMVSRQHVHIEVGRDIVVTDLNSANGLWVNGEDVTKARISSADTLEIGGSTLCIGWIEPPEICEEAPLPPKQHGNFLSYSDQFLRSPHRVIPFSGKRWDAPVVPPPLPKQPFPWPLLVAPLLMGGILFALSGRVTTLAFVVLTPLMMMGNFVYTRLRQVKEHKLAIAECERTLANLIDQVNASSLDEYRSRRDEAPSAHTAGNASMTRNHLLWSRWPNEWDFLCVCLGYGQARSRSKWSDDAGAAEQSRDVHVLSQRVGELVESSKSLSDAPIVESLEDSGIVGIAGGAQIPGVVRGYLLQIAALHSPRDLRIAAILSPEWMGELEWIKWLPHVRGGEAGAIPDLLPQSNVCFPRSLASSPDHCARLLSELEEEANSRQSVPRQSMWATREEILCGLPTSFLRNRASDRAPSPEDTAILCVVSMDAPVDRARLLAFMEAGQSRRVYFVVLGVSVSALPAQCRTVIDLSEGATRARITYITHHLDVQPVAAEVIDFREADKCARALSGLSDAAVSPRSAQVPRTVSLLDLLGHELATDAGFVCERWKQNDVHIDGIQSRGLRRSALKAFLGYGAAEILALDLRKDGPHALVAGTTGSGKSEFLQSWVLSLATAYSPRRVTFLFVDYKGGSAFADCVSLPHCVGLVTDLNRLLVRRVLASLRAEIALREQIIATAGAKDIIDMEQSGHRDTPPALVLIIDEFAALSADVPEFVDGIVDIAQRGRSLGIHLIMATQRPAGVIRDNIRANTAIRIALRMADARDSADVVNSPIAAEFDPAVPGRAVVSTRRGCFTLFQSAFVGGMSDGGSPRTVQVAPFGLRESDREVSHEVLLDDQPPRGSAHLHPSRENTESDCARIVATIRQAAYDGHYSSPRRPWLSPLPTRVALDQLVGMERCAEDRLLCIGLGDYPSRQLQSPVYADLEREGHVIIVGTAGAGKTTLVRTLAVQARYAWVYGIDCAGGGLRGIEKLSHVGSVIAAEDKERTYRLCHSIEALLDARIAGQKIDNAPPVFLVLDGFDAFREQWENVRGKAAPYAVVQRIVADGRAVGVHLIVSVTRFGAVPAPMSARIPFRVFLPLSDDAAYAGVGERSPFVDGLRIPGRAIVGGVDVQCASTSELDMESFEPTAAQRYDDNPFTGPCPDIPVMPRKVSFSEVNEDGAAIAIGLREADLAPVSTGLGGCMILAGPPGSGKTSAINTLIAAYTQALGPCRVVNCGARRGTGNPRIPGEWMIGDSEVVSGIRALRNDIEEGPHEGIVVVVHNVEHFVGTTAEQSLKELCQSVHDTTCLVIVCGEVRAFSGGFGLIGEAKGARHGIILRPEPYDGETIFRQKLPRVFSQEFPPGRGVLFENGDATVIQLAITTL